MDNQIKQHVSLIQELLEETNHDWLSVLQFHRARISFFSHERLIHLLVTLAFGLAFLLSSSFALIYSNSRLGIIAIMFLVLLIPYIIHYFKLENGVQGLYKLDTQLQEKVGF